MAVLKVIELMASSSESWEDATQKGIAKASESLSNIKSAWVQDQSVTVKDGKVSEFRVTI
jgi:flavin-binding protein dodecin